MKSPTAHCNAGTPEWDFLKTRSHSCFWQHTGGLSRERILGFCNQAGSFPATGSDTSVHRCQMGSGVAVPTGQQCRGATSAPGVTDYPSSAGDSSYAWCARCSLRSRQRPDGWQHHTLYLCSLPLRGEERDKLKQVCSTLPTGSGSAVMLGLQNNC